MRFYDISITNQDGNIVLIDNTKMHFTSYIDGFLGGVTNPGALNVEMDIPIVTEDVPAGDAYIKIWGIDLNTLNKASNLNFKNISISGGMKKGLPLANLQANAQPIRNGILFQGSILQAFGNWQGNEQTLDLIVTTRLTAKPTDAPKVQKLIVFQCKEKGSIQDSITKALSDAGISSTVQINSKLVASDFMAAKYETVDRFAQDINTITKNIIKDATYIGVKTIKTDKGYLCTDNSTKGTNPIQIAFTDLIGQPTWLDFNTVQLKCVMRSDIKVGDTITMPQSNVIQGRFFSPKENISYTGTAWVSQVRHIGNFRQADSNSWVTLINCYPNTK